MASKQAIGAAMLGLAANYNRDIAPELVGIWMKALHDVTDEQLDVSVQRIVAESKFFPTVAEVREKAGANAQPLPDTDGILRRIRGLVTFDARYGESMPSVERVRDALGDAIADAYGFVGPRRLEAVVFGGSSVGVDIAAREFGSALQAAQKSGQVIALPSGAEVKQLSNREQSVFLSDAVPQRTGFKRLAP